MEKTTIIYAGAGLVVAKYLCSLVSSGLKSTLMHYKAKSKLKERNAKTLTVPEVEREKQEYILSLQVFQLAEAIKSGKVTSVEATATYIQRAYDIGRKLKLTAEEPFEEALLLAEQRDKQLAENPSSCGVLHGVPISVKDHIGQVGCCSSAGVVWRCNIPDQCDALVLSLLKSEGAVPFVRSNVPQIMIWIESANFIYGCAENPWNRKVTTGGSSGGESGLIASRSSPLGIGSDIGGSIRFPAAFCGIYAFKPTPCRISQKGVHTANCWGKSFLHLGIESSLGPLGRCVEDLNLFLKAVWKEEHWKQDPSVPPLVFNQSLYERTVENKKLRIGYFYDLEIFESAPVIKKALKECKQKLEEQGHELVEFKVPDIFEALEIYLGMYNANGCRPLLDSLKGESPKEFYRLPIFVNSYSTLKSLILKFLELTKNKAMHSFLKTKQHLSSSEYIELDRKLKNYAERFTNYWKDLELDAVISPCYGTLAPPHGKAVDVMPGLAYCILWNVVSYPSGIVPVALASTEDAYYESSIKDIPSSRAKKVMQESAGLPVAIQVSALPFKDELLLGVMKKIEKIFHFYKLPL